MGALHMPSRGQATNETVPQPGLVALLDHIPTALVLLDDDSRIDLWNRAAEDLSGRAREEVVGSSWGREYLVELDELSFLRHGAGHLARVRTHRSPVPRECACGASLAISMAPDSTSMSLLAHARRHPELDLVDALTQLGNRRMAAIEFETFLIRYQLYRREFGVALFDVDLMHEVVSRFGYDCGDRAIELVGRTLADCLDEHDLLCRWGGDQFLALIVGNRRDSQAKADLCRRAIEWCSLEWGGEPVPLTISGGVEMPSPGDHPEDLVGRAAFRLRMSKRLGRNRVTGEAPQAE